MIAYYFIDPLGRYTVSAIETDLVPVHLPIHLGSSKGSMFGP